jgi:photosystem II stability/assembly factor-like uncharacterized protein
MAVGGDYQKPEESLGNIAVTRDSGKSWTTAGVTGPAGYRSAVTYVPRMKAWIAVGITGSSISRDDGKSWREFDHGNFNSVSFAPDGSGFACGPQGRIALFAP